MYIQFYLSTYKSSQLTFRNLTQPVGCFQADKVDQFKAKYFEIVNKQPKLSPYLDQVGSPP